MRLQYMLMPGSDREGWGVFHPWLEWEGKVAPPPLSRVDGSWFLTWEGAFFCSPFAYLGARFADLLWEAGYGGKERHRWAQRAIDTYLQAVDEDFGERVYVAEGARRALDLAMGLGQGEASRQTRAVDALLMLARTDLTSPKPIPGVSIPCLHRLIDGYKKRGLAVPVSELAELLDIALTKMTSFQSFGLLRPEV